MVSLCGVVEVNILVFLLIYIYILCLRKKLCAFIQIIVTGVCSYLHRQGVWPIGLEKTAVERCRAQLINDDNQFLLAVKFITRP